MHSPTRRNWLKRGLLLATMHPICTWSSAAAPAYPAVIPRPLVFPRDYGAHPEYRTEWWYMTGWLGSGAEAIGFQVTFFRSRTQHPEDNPSRFAPRQLMFAHAALALPKSGTLLHAQRSGRAGPAGVSFETADTSLQMAGWTMRRTRDDRYDVYIPADDFTLALEARASSEPVLRGEAGYSLKGPSPELASYYYSRPHLKVSAQITLSNRSLTHRGQDNRLNLSGTAWLDHEWSSSLLMEGAVGWDWIGINLLDGGSLMAFRIRDGSGTTLFSEWDWRDAQGKVLDRRQDVTWSPLGSWRSARSLVTYPSGFRLKVGDREWKLRPLMPDQEVDARASTGSFYYEGAVDLMENDQVLGRGYLELTGYGEALRL